MVLKISSTKDKVTHCLRDCYLPWLAMQRSSFLQGKGRTYISQFFNTLSIGLVPGIKPMTSLSAVKLSAN